MKFSLQNAIEKKVSDHIKILEYCDEKNPFPIDCAIVQFRDGEYPCKINHNFFETFFVLEGECSIIFENETVNLKKHDFFVIPQGKKHISRAAFANVMVTCTPPFDIRNVEFCEMD